VREVSQTAPCQAPTPANTAAVAIKAIA